MESSSSSWLKRSKSQPSNMTMKSAEGNVEKPPIVSQKTPSFKSLFKRTSKPLVEEEESPKRDDELWSRRTGPWTPPKIPDDNRPSSSGWRLNLWPGPQEHDDDKKRGSFLNWFRARNTEDEAVNNPILHLASVAMKLNFDEDKSSESNGKPREYYMEALDRCMVDIPSDTDELSSVGSFDLSDDELVISPIHKHEKKARTMAEKIQIAFELPQLEEVVNEFACWLVRSVLLQGYMYVTQGHICFSSNLAKDEVHLKQGFLQKKSRTSSIFSIYWMVIKDSVLFMYENTTEIYYPVSTLSLKIVTEVKPSRHSTKGFTLVTNRRKYRFHADTEILRNEWVQALKTAVFKARNLGDDVRVVFPFSSVTVQVENSGVLAETLRIRVADDDNSQVEDYYFAYLVDARKTCEILEGLLNAKRDASRPQTMFDTTTTSTLPAHPNRTQGSEDVPSLSSDSQRKPRTIHHRKSHSDIQSNGNIFVEPDGISDVPKRRLLHDSSSNNSIAARANSAKSTNSHDGVSPITIERRVSHKKTLSDSSPTQRSLLRIPSQPELAGSSSASSVANVTSAMDDEVHEKFAIPESDHLVGSYTCYISRLIPILGKLYLTEQNVCFKSKVVGIRAKAIVPVSEIQTVEKEGNGVFYSALILNMKNQDEITFDFHSADARNKSHAMLLNIIAMGRARSTLASGGSGRLSAVLDDVDRQEQHIKSTFSKDELDYIQPLEITRFPSPGPMHITCLTIGTRGDVQPYIALCKQFMKEGHTCRLATHLEYKAWIEGFGIEFREIKGDPAVLMQLCVDNGMFTVAFIREALSKFRGWIDELLGSCWDAVQDTDLLIESPTAMGGVHCAEKLGIPFFSAFPMPWTRTRAYPHPFAVPERHLGGSYNMMTHVMMEQILLKGTSAQVNRWRRQILDLPSITLTSTVDHKIPFLYSFSSSVVPSPPDWQDWIHVCGYWFLDNPEHNWVAPPSLMEFLESGSKPVYIGFGSIVVPDPDEMTRIVLEAVEKAGVRAILSKGWSGRSQELNGGASKPIVYPTSIYPLDKVPHDWLFPLMAGVVHHGGAGTCAAGLRAGVPTLIKPFFGDQYFWADRVHDLGVGLFIRKLAVDKLASALVTLTTDVKMREKASLLGEKIRSEDGVGTAVQYIYRDLEYARKRIRKLAVNNKRSMYPGLPL